MNESRLRQAAECFEAGRDLLVAIVDDRAVGDGSLRDFNYVDASRQFANSAIEYVHLADSEYIEPAQDCR